MSGGRPTPRPISLPAAGVRTTVTVPLRFADDFRVEARVSTEGGTLLYLRQEGRGIGLYAKLDAYALQDQGADTYEANLALGRGEDERDYTAAAQMLRAVGIDRLRLLTNNPDKAAQLTAHGIAVEEVLPTGVHLTPANARYLRAKRDRTGHLLDLTAA